jgi:hypothetical protein
MSETNGRPKANQPKPLAPSRSLMIHDEVANAVRIAAAYRGMRIPDYVAEVLMEAARRDISEHHKQWEKPVPPKS